MVENLYSDEIEAKTQYNSIIVPGIQRYSLGLLSHSLMFRSDNTMCFGVRVVIYHRHHAIYLCSRDLGLLRSKGEIVRLWAGDAISKPMVCIPHSMKSVVYMTAIFKMANGLIANGPTHFSFLLALTIGWLYVACPVSRLLKSTRSDTHVKHSRTVKK